MKKEKIIIVGERVIGLSAAYCSFGNMGLLAPSVFVPLASRAAISEGSKSLLNRARPVAG